MIYVYRSYRRIGIQSYTPKEIGMPQSVAYAYVDCSEVESPHTLERGLIEAISSELARRGFSFELFTRKPTSHVTANAAPEFLALVGSDQWFLADVALHARSGYMGTDVLLAAAPDGDGLHLFAWGAGAYVIVDELLRQSRAADRLELRFMGDDAATGDVLRQLSDLGYRLQLEYGKHFDPVGYAPTVFGGVIGGGLLHVVEGLEAELLGPGTRGGFHRSKLRRRRRFSSRWVTLTSIAAAERDMRRCLDAWIASPPWERHPPPRRRMNKDEARQLLHAAVAELRAKPRGELLRLIDGCRHEEVTAPSGAWYQLEHYAFWDDAPRNNLRVTVAIDDGGWSAFKPMLEDFIVAPDGSFVGE